MTGDLGVQSTPYQWSHLTALQVGKYAEYLVKMEFTRLGFSVYSVEVDDRGIDFVVRKDENTYFDAQVKSGRGFTYIFYPKEKFPLRKNLLAAIVLFFEDNPPQLYLIPSLAWLQPDGLLRDREYDQGQKSKPEWGLNISRKNLPLLQRFLFDKVVADL